MSSPVPPWSYPPAPPAWGTSQRRRRSRWLTVGLPVGLLVAALLAVGAVVLVRTVMGAVGPVSDAAGRYADALVAGDWDGAHGQLCAVDRVAITPDDLAALWGSPQVVEAEVVGVWVENQNGVESATAQLGIRFEGELRNQTTVPLVREDGVWRPCP